jgi:hypothetical protein
MIQQLINKLNHYTGPLLLASIIASCNTATGAKEDLSETTTQPAPESITQVVTAIAKNKTFDYLIQCNGKIKSMREQLITTETGGRLQVCKAHTGAFFSADELIAELDATSVLHKLERARFARFNSEKEYESQLLGYETLLKSTGSRGYKTKIKDQHWLSRSRTGY